MRALRFYPSVPRYLLAGGLGKRYPVSQLPLALVELPPPEPPPGWQKVKVRLSGICASDVSLLYGQVSARLSGFFSVPAVLGHEILGEVGGVRVAVNPVLACRERELEPCQACARGDDAHSLCQGAMGGRWAPGILGVCRDLPGGWSEGLIAASERLYPVSDAVPDERAVLAEPLAVVLRALRRAFPGGQWPKDLLVIGAGIIGLLVVRALRLLGYRGSIHQVARHPHQAAFAKEMGASHVHASAWDAAKSVGATSYKAIIGPPAWRGGFSATIDAAGTRSSLEQVSWSVSEGGTVLLLGAVGEIRHDFSPIWSHDLRLVGSYSFNHEDFEKAVALLAEAEGLERLVGARYALERWREALAAVRERRAVKVVFAPNLPA